MSVRIGLVGAGKIARDQHLPAIRDHAEFSLVACADPRGGLPDVPAFASLEAMLAEGPELDAVALCTPPQGRHALAALALRAGKHVLLEKPPAAGLAELESLSALAAAQGVSLYTAWHSQAAAGVAPAKAWLAGRRPLAVRVDWREDVRQWHPGQQWIWAPGGLGVFDPGINALSILSYLIDGPIRVEAGELWTPANRQTPIRARLALAGPDQVPIACDFDWTFRGDPCWNITIDTDGGELLLSHGGNRLAVGGRPVEVGPEREYPNLYREFAALIARGASHADGRPLQLVADAYLLAARHAADPFDD